MTHAVAVVVEQNALVLGRLAQLMAELLRVLKGWIEVLRGRRGSQRDLSYPDRRRGAREAESGRLEATHQLVADLLRQRLELPLEILADLLDCKEEKMSRSARSS
jgi:hypothetical protein